MAISTVRLPQDLLTIAARLRARVTRRKAAGYTQTEVRNEELERLLELAPSPTIEEHAP